MKRVGVALAACLALLVLSAPAAGAAEGELVSVSPAANGAKRMLYRIGPFQVVPGVNVIHLHHGVWLNLSRRDVTWPGLPERFFAAGEEKTITTFPKGYGYR